MIQIKNVVKEVITILIIVFILSLCYHFFSPVGLLSVTQFPKDMDTSNGSISLDNAYKCWKNGVMFVDIRSEFQFHEGHIPGAILLPYFSFDEIINEILPILKDKTQIILYCNNDACNSSEIICNRMKAVGLEHVNYFKGGFRDWEQADFPIELSTIN